MDPYVPLIGFVRQTPNSASALLDPDVPVALSS